MTNSATHLPRQSERAARGFLILPTVDADIRWVSPIGRSIVMVCVAFLMMAALVLAMVTPIVVGENEMRRLKRKGVIK